MKTYTATYNQSSGTTRFQGADSVAIPIAPSTNPAVAVRDNPQPAAIHPGCRKSGTSSRVAFSSEVMHSAVFIRMWQRKIHADEIIRPEFRGE